MNLSAIYDPRAFVVGTSLDAARRIILTDEGMESDERWRTETPHLVGMILDRIGLDAGSLVLDYGCGIGRLAKPLIERSGCHVVGADFSYDMLALAVRHVASPQFICCTPAAIDRLGLRFDLILAVWVLQHVPALHNTVDWIFRMLLPGGRMFVVNNVRRAVPTDRGWVDDGHSVLGALDGALKRLWCEKLDPVIVSPELSAQTFCGVWERT